MRIVALPLFMGLVVLLLDSLNTDFPQNHTMYETWLSSRNIKTIVKLELFEFSKMLQAPAGFNGSYQVAACRT